MGIPHGPRSGGSHVRRVAPPSPVWIVVINDLYFYEDAGGTTMYPSHAGLFEIRGDAMLEASTWPLDTRVVEAEPTFGGWRETPPIGSLSAVDGSMSIEDNQQATSIRRDSSMVVRTLKKLRRGGTTKLW